MTDIIPDSILEIKKKSPKPKKVKKSKQKKVGETCSEDSECKGKGCCANGVCEKGNKKVCKDKSKKSKTPPKKSKTPPKKPAKKSAKKVDTVDSIKEEIEKLRNKIVDTEDKKKEEKYIKKIEKLTKKLVKLEKKKPSKKAAKKSSPKGLTTDEKIKKKQFCDDWEDSKKSIKDNKVMNPKTKRTVAIGSRTYKKFDKECEDIKDILKDVKISKKVKKVEGKSADILFCEEIKENMKNMKDGKVFNPKTNRMVSANSRTFKKIVKDCDKVLEEVKKVSPKKKTPAKKKTSPFKKPKLPKRKPKTKKKSKKKTPTKVKTPSPVGEPWSPTPQRAILSESLLEFIKEFESETGEKNVKEAFIIAIIESLEEFDDMLNDGTIFYQNFLPAEEGEEEHSTYPASTDREQKLINKLIKYYKSNYEEEGSDVEEITEESPEGDITDLIESLKPEFNAMKKDLKKKLSKEDKKIDIKKLESELKEEIEKRQKKKIPAKKQAPKKKDNKFRALLEDVKESKLTNEEINSELKKLKLDNDIEYLKQIILLRLESML